MTIIGMIVFSGDFAPDPDAAAVALRSAGFEVGMMPEKHRWRLADPEDYFMEAVIEGDGYDDKIVSAIWDEINGIVNVYGGSCFECGSMDSDYVPFEDALFGPTETSRQLTALHRRGAARRRQQRNLSRSETSAKVGIVEPLSSCRITIAHIARQETAALRDDVPR